MAQTIPNPACDTFADRSADAPFLLYERLDCYRLAIEFQSLAARVLSNRSVGSNLRDQLDRASTSIVLNIAEGAGRATPRDKAQFFTIARGSAMECASIFDVLSARMRVSAHEQRLARGSLIRIVQMLTRLIARQRVE